MPDLRPRTDRELDDLLAALAGPSAGHDLDRLRARLLAGTPVPRPRRRHRRLVVGAAVIACTAAGAVGAAATGMFDTQLEKAFSQTVAGGYDIDSDTITERAAVDTPDGGHAGLYTATGRTGDGGPAACITVLFTDPGVTPPGKPYRPQAGCHPDAGPGADDITSGSGVDWFSTTGGRFKIVYGHTDPDAVTAIFTDISGTSVSTPVHDGYLLDFVPETTPEQGLRGMTVVDADGFSTVLSTPVPYQGG